MATGCARLEAAAALLADAGAPAVAPQLEAEIADALGDLQPAATLEHLQAGPQPCVLQRSNSNRNRESV